MALICLGVAFIEGVIIYVLFRAYRRAALELKLLIQTMEEESCRVTHGK